MRVVVFKSDGNVIALDQTNRPVRLPAGVYAYARHDGSMARLETGEGMSGFWSSLGTGFRRVGSWIGDHFGEIATLGTTIYVLHAGGQLGQNQLGGAQQQAAANAAAQQQAQAQEVNSGFDLGGILPIAIIALLGFVLLRNNNAR